MDTSNGLLSQALQNLLVTSNNLANLAGLPPEAQGVEATAVALLKDEIKDIKSIQAAISQFVHASQPGIQQAQTDLETNTQTDKIAAIITQVNQSATILKENTDSLNTGVNVTRRKISDLFASLTPIRSQLDTQKINHTTELQSAEQEVEVIRSNYKYLLFLGPFGLVGLLAAGIALGVQEGKVSRLQAQASSLRAQLSSLDALMQAINLMGKDLMDAVTKISNLANAVTYLSCDTSAVIKDLHHVGGGQAMAKIYLLTTLHQLQTLGNDAS